MSIPQPPKSLTDDENAILLLQEELAATNQEVMLLTLELEQRVAERTAELFKSNQALIMEVAERKKAEEEIKKLNDDLLRRASLLESANDELESFSYSVSHDLRAPLRHIIGYAAMLQEDVPSAVSETAQQYLEKIQTSANKMATLIDELLQFSRTSRTELRLAPVALNTLIEEVIGDFQQETKGRKVLWKHDPLPNVRGDVAMLRQVFVNLISNAVKYTQPRDSSTIEIGSSDHDQEAFVIFVRDNGVGFDPRYSDKLFGVFQRLHSDKEFEGIGIGLANVRRIIMRHGGRTWAEGKPGEGATFYFSLPKEKSA
jgi:light-regulated signal transduction histidine kinase (bacteriophytochrome)